MVEAKILVALSDIGLTPGDGVTSDISPDKLTVGSKDVEKLEGIATDSAPNVQNAHIGLDAYMLLISVNVSAPN